MVGTKPPGYVYVSIRACPISVNPGPLLDRRRDPAAPRRRWKLGSARQKAFRELLALGQLFQLPLDPVDDIKEAGVN